MKTIEKWLPYLCCPETKSELYIENNQLLGGAKPYPIINGIPRFIIGDNYSESFGKEWRRWSKLQFESENVNTPMEGHTKNMFDKIVGNVDGIVGDIGCGAGRFIDIARKKNAKVIGLDFSSACEVAHENFKDDDDVLIVQADALMSPLRNLDYAYSIGVLHHTPNAEKGLHSMIQSAASIAVHLYQKNGFYDSFKVIVYRKIFKILGHDAALAYAYLASKILRRLPKILWKPFVIACPQDERWCYLDTFDAITPSFQTTHTSSEIEGWIKKYNFIPQKIAKCTYRGLKNK